MGHADGGNELSSTLQGVQGGPAAFGERTKREVKKGNYYGSDIYERKKDTSAGGIHVTAYGHFHGGQFAVQYY